MRRALIPAFLLLLGSLLLGSTVFRDQAAHAAQTVGATIIGPLDANGNVRVHEQGAVSLAAPSPITGGGGDLQLGPHSKVVVDGTASALVIHMSDNIDAITISSANGDVISHFVGPHSGGNASVERGSSRPPLPGGPCRGRRRAGPINTNWVGGAAAKMGGAA